MYYDAICAVKLNQIDANKKVEQFVEKHPYHNKKEKAYLTVADYYFANRKASHALKWYQKVNEDFLSQEEKDEFNYKMGYALLVSNYLKDAKARFKVLLGNPIYGNDARYYYGYISYKQENFGEAEDNLSQLADDATYQTKANYYILDISFKAGRFDKSIEIGEKLLETTKKENEASQIAKIIGESYFNLGKYEKAIPYLRAYKGTNGKWNNTDYYYLGYAYYKKKEYDNAITNFNKIIEGTNKVAQNAYYHLGECYLELDKKGEALNAFKNASEMDFDSKITESAWLNYAKLSYEQGNPYQSVPEVLKTYLTKYPLATEHNEIQNLLISSYVNQQDYQGALAYLKNNPAQQNTKVIIQEISMYRGIQLFNEQKIKEAQAYFKTASGSSNIAVADTANYWLGETHYLLGDYEAALERFFLVKNPSNKEFQQINYNIGYAHFKLQNYRDAAVYFESFLKSDIENSDLKDDTANRLGDSYYAERQYEKAVKAYTKVIDDGGIGADYAQYQIAMSKGFLGDNSSKITNLETLVSTFQNSQLVDDALFQIGNTYTTQKQVKEALKTYDKILLKHPNSNYIPSVLLRQGLLYYTANDNQKAIEKYKSVVKEYPNSSEAKQAVTNLKNVYIDLGKVEEYAVWAKNIKFINVTNAELDNATYQAAENKFLENDTNAAIKGFENYLSRFPAGIHSLKANFFLAQSLKKVENLSSAVPYYQYVTLQQKSEYTEEALVNLSKIYLDKEKWKEAIAVLQQLEQDANYPQNRIFAQSNLMKGYYLNENYEKAIVYGDKILSTGKIENVIAEDAKLILARSYFKTNDYENAAAYFEDTSNKATGAVKAECLYYNSLFLHEQKEYESSNKAIENLIANYSSYTYWGVKSYIIMAKNYYALKDAYQATYILDNVIKNFSQYKDLVEAAKNELNTIKNKEAKTNESVTNKS
ncbi:tetratricopeptide repeat protein [Tenacibaculum sp. SG-28]|uniref:tetratricopeptide repeat protein n=1 Tax=Tenacibaculum sp. SG-28 TaxID=754426 RepID=UPI000D49DCA9|nr:tetratricopeptide repeat protein [Tenacibaculum sp. SG-28]PQJ22959.1 hypothetical protein BSU00_01390 [Tenacibaculum sp. SG-28]